MKKFTVYFILEKDNHGFMNQISGMAKTEAEAIAKAKKEMLKNGHMIYHCSTNKPVKTSSGLEYNGTLYTKYDDCFHQLY